MELQPQVVTLVLPKVEFAGQMTGHAKHNESPLTSLYVPDEHKVRGVGDCGRRQAVALVTVCKRSDEATKP